MHSLDPVDFAAIALFVGALAAVCWEIAVKSPRSFLEMIVDSRGFAERPLRREVPSAERAVVLARPDFAAGRRLPPAPRRAA